MSIAMPGPWKHPTTSTYYLKQRVPADLVKTAAGMTVVLPVDGAPRPVKIGDQVKISLQTKDPRIAKDRHREADDALALHWKVLRSAPVELSTRQRLALAGEVYRGLVDRLDEEPGEAEHWKTLIRYCAAATASEGNPQDGLDQETSEILEATFRGALDPRLSRRGIRLTQRGRDLVLFEIAIAVAAAAGDIMRKAEGDYSATTTGDRYPVWKDAPSAAMSGPDGQTVSGLFEVWKAEREREGRSGSTAARWSAPVRDFVKFLEHDDAGRVRPEDIVRWREAVLATGATIPRTFNRVHLCAVRSIFNEGRGKKLTTNNPTEGLSFRVSKARQSRPKGFVDEEAVAILRAASRALEAPGKTSDVMRRVQRWVPWLCAYTGARVGEMT